MKVYVGGDSWACGEWQADPSHHTGVSVAHAGLSQYLRDRGYKVINCASGGACNRETVGLLDNELVEIPFGAKTHYEPGDIVIWVQTDHIRNLRHIPPNRYEKLTPAIKEAGGVYNLAINLLIPDYTRLNSIAERHNCIIHCIGGSANIHVSITNAKFKNLNCLVKSWNQLLLPLEDMESGFMVSPMDWATKDIDMNQFDTPLRYKVIDEMTTIAGYQHTFDRYPQVYPDRLHPDRNGHKILFDTVIKELNL